MDNKESIQKKSMIKKLRDFVKDNYIAFIILPLLGAVVVGCYLMRPDNSFWERAQNLDIIIGLITTIAAILAFNNTQRLLRQYKSKPIPTYSENDSICVINLSGDRAETDTVFRDVKTTLLASKDIENNVQERLEKSNEDMFFDFAKQEKLLEKFLWLEMRKSLNTENTNTSLDIFLIGNKQESVPFDKDFMSFKEELVAVSRICFANTRSRIHLFYRGPVELMSFFTTYNNMREIILYHKNKNSNKYVCLGVLDERQKV